MSRAFWEEMSQLAVTHAIVIDRPKGKPHPNWNELVYPLDYGYLEGTSASDGSGIDVWLGSLGGRSLTGILCTYDRFKRDAELKLLLGCTPEDVQIILAFHDENMRVLYIPHPKEKE
jgi:inorganic pyrophosphatase